MQNCQVGDTQMVSKIFQYQYSLGLGNRVCKNLTIHLNFLPLDSRDRHRAVQPDHRQLPLCRAGLLDPERRLQHHVLRDGRQGIPLVVPPVARHIHLPGMYSRLVKKNKGWNGTEKTVSTDDDFGVSGGSTHVSISIHCTDHIR